MNSAGSDMMRTGMYNVGMQQQMAPKQLVKKQEKTETPQEREPVQHKETKEQPRDRADISTQGGHEKPRVQERKSHQVMQKFVSSAKTKGAEQVEQEKDLKQAREQEETREQGFKPDESHPKAPLDNASRIGLMYKSKQRQNARNAQNRVSNEPQVSQKQQLKNFLGKLKNMVANEYKQPTSNDLYSRRNLREILHALGDDVKAFDNKQAKDRRERSTNGVEDVKVYNKHYAAKATKQLKLFNDDPMNQKDYMPFDLVA